LINTPTLVVAGEFDMVVPPALCEELAREIKGAQFKIIKGGAHAFFDEKPFEVNEIILGFLLARSDTSLENIRNKMKKLGICNSDIKKAIKQARQRKKV
jgi:dienelactone hydrolase